MAVVGQEQLVAHILAVALVVLGQSLRVAYLLGLVVERLAIQEMVGMVADITLAIPNRQRVLAGAVAVALMQTQVKVVFLVEMAVE
jgi:uncharacterized protein (UPF0303 family)